MLPINSIAININNNQMSAPKSKLIDRFRTQIIKSGRKSIGLQSPRFSYQSSANIRLNYDHSTDRQRENHIILQRMQQHIQYIQKKLKDTQLQYQKSSSLCETYRILLIQKDSTIENILSQKQQLDNIITKLTEKHQCLQSNYQSLHLQQKMIKLNQEIGYFKEMGNKIQMRHKRHKRGKFSSAFVPSPFGSPLKFEERQPQQYEAIIDQFQIQNLRESGVRSKQSVSDCLLDEWTKVTKQKSKREKQVQILKHQSVLLKQKLEKKIHQMDSMEIQHILIQQKLNLELNTQKEKVNSCLRDNKLLMNKLKSNEQRMVQISMSMKEKIEHEDEKALSYQSINQIQQLLQNANYHLFLVSETVNIRIESSPKKQNAIQTENPQYHESTQHLQQKIATLSKIIADKDRQIKKRQQQIKAKHQQEINEYIKQMNLYKEKIDQLDSLEISNQKIRIQDQETEYFKQNITEGVDQHEEGRLGKLVGQNQQLRMQIQSLQAQISKNSELSQFESQESFRAKQQSTQNKSQIIKDQQCKNCDSLQAQITLLTQKIQAISSQQLALNSAYNSVLSSYKQYQIQAKAEIYSLSQKLNQIEKSEKGSQEKQLQQHY